MKSSSRFKLQYISDIHLEHRTSIPKIPAKTNNLALLGDIGHPNKPLYSEFLKHCSNNWDKVLLLSGNHEYEQSKYSMKEIDHMIHAIANKYPNITYLNNRKLLLDNHLILGTTLWSDSTKTAPSHKINDLYYKSLYWLEENIKQNSDKDIIVLTHYLPSYQLIIPKYYGYNAKYQFASDLDYLIEKPVKAWLCGHSHCQIEKYVNGVYCGINTLGYPYEALEQHMKVLEL